MLYWLFIPLVPLFQGFNLFRYISFRAAFAAILSFLVVLVCAPGLTGWLRVKRLSGCAGHDSETLERLRRGKNPVPTMGGLLILLAVTISTLLLARLDNVYIVVSLLAFLALGALGAIDDWSKIAGGGRKGLRERSKLLGQTAIVGAALLVWYLQAAGAGHEALLRGPHLEASPYRAQAAVALVTRRAAPGEPPASGPVGPTEVAHPAGDHRTDLQVPLFKHFCLDLGLLFLVFGGLVVVGASNAVNLTDGLDGLATGCVSVTALSLGIVAYITGRADAAAYLYLFHIPGAGELTVFCAALGGSALGFLWFNSHPATIFMGDTGSLALGGGLGLAAVATRHEFTLLVAGGIFVVEALSVILQRRFFRLTGGRRLFRCAPLHHHYEFQGMPESKITVRFWIVSILLALFALALLKMR